MLALRERGAGRHVHPHLEMPPVGTEVEMRDFAIPAFDRIPRQVRFCCKGRVTRVESCYEVAGFAVVGRIESEQLGDGIEEAAAGLLTGSNARH